MTSTEYTHIWPYDQTNAWQRVKLCKVNVDDFKSAWLLQDANGLFLECLPGNELSHPKNVPRRTDEVGKESQEWWIASRGLGKWTYVYTLPCFDPLSVQIDAHYNATCDETDESDFVSVQNVRTRKYLTVIDVDNRYACVRCRRREVYVISLTCNAGDVSAFMIGANLGQYNPL